MAAISRINVQQLLTWYLRFPSAQQEPMSASFLISACILNHYLGEDWLSARLDNNSKISKYLSVDTKGPYTEITQIQSYKIVDLAELVFNLQHIEGFDNCIARLRTGEPEAPIAELDAARLLFINNHNVRFVTEAGKKKSDYDLEIVLKPWTICVEAKCKLESTKPSESTVINALSYSRKQLPKDRPGVIFVKIPQSWMEKYLWNQFLTECAKTFFSQRAERIVSVIFYIGYYKYDNGVITQGHELKEVYNFKNRFDQTVNWRLLGRHTPPVDSVNAMPTKWLRLVGFPNGIKEYEEPGS